MLFIVASALFSCSSDDTTSGNSQKVLQKVVFYKGTANERHWKFTNSQLTQITTSDGTLVEEFFYDAQKRLIKDVKYTNGVITDTDDITYNADNTISTIDALPYFYNAATKTYTYSYGSNFTIDCQVNSDMLVVDFVREGFNPSEYHIRYANRDMVSFKKVNSGISEIEKNFHFASHPVYTGGNQVFEAILSVAKVKSLTDPGFFADCQVSATTPEGFDCGTINPYYYNYGISPDTSGKLLQVDIEVLDPDNNAVDFYSFADYHFL